MKEPVIVGIDPGTTLGYAILSVDGEVIKVGSLKVHSLHDLISIVITHGHVIAVGCDKKQVPSFVETFRVKTGARLVSPPRDLLVAEKRDLVEGFPCTDSHQMDALASARFSYASLRSLIRKVRLFISRNGKEEHAPRLFDLVVRQGFSIRHAMDLIERPEDPEVSMMKDAALEDRFTKEGFTRIYSRMRKSEDESERLRDECARLREALKEVKRFAKRGGKREKKALSQGSKVSGVASAGLQKALSKEQALRRSAGYDADVLRGALLRKDDIVVFQVVEDLGKRFPPLPSIVTDKLFVIEPAVWSKSVIAAIEGKVSLLASGKAFPKPLRQGSFGLVNLEQGSGTRIRGLLILEKKGFESAKKKVLSFEDIIDDYKRLRQQM